MAAWAMQLQLAIKRIYFPFRKGPRVLTLAIQWWAEEPVPCYRNPASNTGKILAIITPRISDPLQLVTKSIKSMTKRRTFLYSMVPKVILTRSCRSLIKVSINHLASKDCLLMCHYLGELIAISSWAPIKRPILTLRNQFSTPWSPWIRES